jgi:hypothetical protein
MAEREPKWDFYSTFREISVTPPAVRMMGLTASIDADDDEPYTKRYPVVALVTRVESNWIREAQPDGDEPPKGRTPEEMIALGWRFTGESMSMEPWVAEYDLFGVMIDWDEVEKYGCCERTYMLACPWPQEEDDARLRPIEADLKVSAVSIYRHRTNKPAPPP